MSKAAAHTSTDTSGRGARRREETREKLTAAARRLFAAKGVEATRINEITEEADVGFGSFYNHFENKDAIVEAVMTQTIATQAARVDAVTAQLEDPAEVISVAHRYFVRLARRDPDWAWLLVRLDASHDLIGTALFPYASRDLARAVESGRLAVPDERVALLAAGGALVIVMRAVLDGRLPVGSDVPHAEGVLRMLGLSGEEAAAVAQRPFPAIGE